MGIFRLGREEATCDIRSTTVKSVSRNNSEPREINYLCTCFERTQFFVRRPDCRQLGSPGNLVAKRFPSRC